MSGRKKLEVGDRFGKWVVVGAPFKRGVDKSFYYPCRCDCGNEKSVVRQGLVRGVSKSCGCVRNKWTADRSRPVHQIAAITHYKSYVRNSESRSSNFGIDETDFHLITSRPCHYCSAAPTEHMVRRKKGRTTIYKVGSGYFANGIDRVDSSRGYEVGNVVSCCYTCNSSKSNLSYSDFLSMCNRVSMVHPAELEVSNG